METKKKIDTEKLDSIIDKWEKARFRTPQSIKEFSRAYVEDSMSFVRDRIMRDLKIILNEKENKNTGTP